MTQRSAAYAAAEISARQSISTLVFHGYRPLGEGALQALVANGITRIELLESPEQFDMTDLRSMAAFGRMLSDCGVAVGAYHCHRTHFNDIRTEAERRERVDTCRRQIDTMVEMGGNLWGCHAGETDSTVRRSYEELAAHVDGTEITIAVENFTREGVVVEDRMAFLDDMDHPQVGMILDIGHVRDHDGRNPMTLVGGPTRILALCGQRLRHLHLHGFKDGRDHHSPMVDGDGIQWAELFQQLRHVEYQGWFNFEPANELHNPDVLEHTGKAPERIAALLG